jgi:hypothetical protein
VICFSCSSESDIEAEDTKDDETSEWKVLRRSDGYYQICLSSPCSVSTCYMHIQICYPFSIVTNEFLNILVTEMFHRKIPLWMNSPSLKQHSGYPSQKQGQ